MNSIGHGGPRSVGALRSSSDSVVLEALSQFLPAELVRSVLTRTARYNQRLRRLPATAVVWLVIGIGLWGDLDIPAIWRQIVGTLRSLYLIMGEQTPPCKSALSTGRTRLGPLPLRQLFVETARPIAENRTRGAFYKGMRLRAIDGVTLKVPDTRANAKAFGRTATRRKGERVVSGYPQIHVIFLSETGTHIYSEAIIKPAKRNEYPIAPYLLDRVMPGELVLWDKGFHGYHLVAKAIQLGIHVLGRVGADAVFMRERPLCDGSFLSTIYPASWYRQHNVQGQTVRIIEYTLDDPHRPGHGERHRLLTTLLDADQFPALELIALYHERWEVEIANDELKTHQLDRLVNLRSRTPCGVVQELYGILIAYNAVRFLMHAAALSVEVDPRQLSFIHAVRVIQETIPLLRAASTEKLPRLYAGMILHIAQGRLPPRDNRINPRVVKCKMSKFKKKRPEHDKLPQPQKHFLATVVMLK